MALSHDDGKVIVDLAHVPFRIGAKTVEIFTDLDAFETLALQASCGLADSFFPGIALPRFAYRYGRERCDILRVCVKSGGNRTFARAGCRQGDLLQEPVDRDGSEPAMEME